MMIVRDTFFWGAATNRRSRLYAVLRFRCPPETSPRGTLRRDSFDFGPPKGGGPRPAKRLMEFVPPGALLDVRCPRRRLPEGVCDEIP